MNNKLVKESRKALLDLAKTNEVLSFDAYFLCRKNESWLTFSQLKLVNGKDVLATHFNLPEYKLSGNFKADKENQKVSIKAIPSSYLQKGIKKGTLKGFGASGVIEINIAL